MDYTLLKIELEKPEYSNLTHTAATAALKINNFIIEWQDVDMRDVLNWLIKVDPATQVAVWDKLEAATTSESYPYILRQALKRFLVTVQSNIRVLNFRLSELVDYLPYVVMLGIITQSEADEFLDLSRQCYTAEDIGHARNLDRIELCKQIEEQAGTAAGEALRLVQNVYKQLIEGESVEVPTFQELIDKFTQSLGGG